MTSDNQDYGHQSHWSHNRTPWWLTHTYGQTWADSGYTSTASQRPNGGWMWTWQPYNWTNYSNYQQHPYPVDGPTYANIAGGERGPDTAGNDPRYDTRDLRATHNPQRCEPPKQPCPQIPVLPRTRVSEMTNGIGIPICVDEGTESRLIFCSVLLQNNDGNCAPSIGKQCTECSRLQALWFNAVGNPVRPGSGSASGKFYCAFQTAGAGADGYCGPNCAKQCAHCLAQFGPQ